MEFVECSRVICVVQINLVGIKNALGCQSEKKISCTISQFPQNINGVELLIDVVNSTHVLIILFRSFRLYDCFTIDLFSLGAYHYCIMSYCQHVHYFLLIAHLILMGTILHAIFGSPFDDL